MSSGARLRRLAKCAVLASGVAVVLAGSACKRKTAPPSTDPVASTGSTSAPFPPPPKGWPPLAPPPTNPLTSAKVALGWQLFFDPRLSTDGTQTCNSCHRLAPEDGAVPAKPREPVSPPKAATAQELVRLVRDTPALWNVGYKRVLFWDGRATSLEQAVESELGERAGDLKERVAAVAKVGGYIAAFEKAFPGEGITVASISKGIASALRSAVCADAPFDRYSAGDATVMTEQAQAGWKLFEGKAGCTGCHAPPFFSDAYGQAGAAGTSAGAHNTGVGVAERNAESLDPGRAAVTHDVADTGGFVTPTLRNVTRTAPYFHDGSVGAIGAAVISMARGGKDNPHHDKALLDHGLMPSELQAILDFLPALECRADVMRPRLPPGATPAPR